MSYISFRCSLNYICLQNYGQNVRQVLRTYFYRLKIKMSLHLYYKRNENRTAFRVLVYLCYFSFYFAFIFSCQRRHQKTISEDVELNC